MACLEFPRFNGVDPLGWLYRAEQFFLHQQTPGSQNLLMTSFHLERKALQWFSWMEKSNAIASWDDFSHRLLTQFGPSPYDDPIALLTKMRQTPTNEQYQTQFEELANHTEGLNKFLMVSYFIGSLK